MNTKTQNESRVWLITGTSSGIGQELVRAVLKSGDHVVATSRRPETVAATFPEAGDRLMAVAMDLRDPNQIESVVKAAVDRFGRIDVLVNNAGHGFASAVEEADDAEIASATEINVHGLLRVTRAVLPVFREQKSGHVVNFSSVSGLVGLAGFGIYCANKFAVEGLSEALAAESAPLGIKVTIVEPGPFRTAFLDGSMAFSKRTIDDYAGTAGQFRAGVATRNGKQPGDPVRAAEAIIQAVRSPRPPLHLLLGKFAYELALKKLDSLRKEFEEWRPVTFSADFPS